MNNSLCARAYLLGIQVAINTYGISVPPERELSHLALLRQIADSNFSVHDPEAIIPDSEEGRLALQQINAQVISSDRELARSICNQLITT